MKRELIIPAPTITAAARLNEIIQVRYLELAH